MQTRRHCGTRCPLALPWRRRRGRQPPCRQNLAPLPQKLSRCHCHRLPPRLRPKAGSAVWTPRFWDRGRRRSRRLWCIRGPHWPPSVASSDHGADRLRARDGTRLWAGSTLPSPPRPSHWRPPPPPPSPPSPPHPLPSQSPPPPPPRLRPQHLQRRTWCSWCTATASRVCASCRRAALTWSLPTRRTTLACRARRGTRFRTTWHGRASGSVRRPACCGRAAPSSCTARPPSCGSRTSRSCVPRSLGSNSCSTSRGCTSRAATRGCRVCAPTRCGWSTSSGSSSRAPTTRSTPRPRPSTIRPRSRRRRSPRASAASQPRRSRAAARRATGGRSHARTRAARSARTARTRA